MAKARSLKVVPEQQEEAQPAWARDERGYAMRGEVEAFAEGLKDSFLACRELGHNWMPRTAVLDKQGFYDRVLRCSRCRTERHQTISRLGEVLSNQYHYPESYQAKGVGRIVGEGREALRLESLLRVMAPAVKERKRA